MDALIKNNIIKKNKLAVDIGTYAARVLEIRYAAKKVTVTASKEINSKDYTDGGEISFSLLAAKIDAEMSGQGRGDVMVSVPGDLCENKIITVKNKKESEIPKIIKKDYMTFGRANPVTHVADYAFLGKREEEGDTVFYYLVSAIQKSVAGEIVSAFEKHKLKVKTIVSSIYNQICLSELYFDEYEHLNRLFVDFGANSTRITAFSEGMPVYTRSIETGFNSYVTGIFDTDEEAGKPEIVRALVNVGEHTDLAPDIIGGYFNTLDFNVYKKCIEETGDYLATDISRVIDLCATNDFSVSKIYCTGYAVKGLEKRIADKCGVDVEAAVFNSADKKDSKDYTLEIDDVYMNEGFSNAVGLGIYPML